MPKQESATDNIRASSEVQSHTLTGDSQTNESGQNQVSEFEQYGKFCIPKRGWNSVLISEDNLEPNH